MGSRFGFKLGVANANLDPKGGKPVKIRKRLKI
jgi:hypothetical protein